MSNKNNFKNVGGQALIEGVMMKDRQKTAIAVRKLDGEIIVKESSSRGFTEKYKINKIPFLRGAITLIETMFTGFKSLNFSAEFFEVEEDKNKEDKFEKFMRKIFKDKAENIIMFFSIVIALLISIGVFMVLPTFIVQIFNPLVSSNLTLNIIEGLVRITMFVSYVLIVSKLKEIRRVFQYHGAEHKAIYTFEAEEDLTVENAKKHTTLHPRCGTNFVFIVMMVSIVTFSFFSWPDPLLRAATRIALLPLIAGISYEIIKLAGKVDNPIMRVINYPGLMLQKLTTKEPDERQLEVALVALKAAVGMDYSEDIERNKVKEVEPNEELIDIELKDSKPISVEKGEYIDLEKEFRED